MASIITRRHAACPDFAGPGPPGRAARRGGDLRPGTPGAPYPYAGSMRSGASRPPVASPAVAVLDVLGKAVLLAFLVVVLLDPAWGNLEGKAPTARALTYPLLAFAVPLWWQVRRPPGDYPWLADLLLTLAAFSDILGNRLDLYDRVAWFDDVMHVAVVTWISAALVLLTMTRTSSAVAVLERSVALG